MNLNNYCNSNEMLLVYSGNYDKDTAIFPFIPNIYYTYLHNYPLDNSYIAYFPKTQKQILYYTPVDTKWNDDYSRFNITNKAIIQKPIQDLWRDLYSYRPKKIISNSILSESPIFNKLNSSYQLDLTKLENRINKDRDVKTQTEIKKIEASCKMNSLIFKYIISKVRSYKNEKDIINDIDCTLKTLDSNATFAYLPICSNDKDNAILHYTYNKKSIKPSSLILLDCGCKKDGYCSDVTRTFPSSGKFTNEQKTIYNIVLNCFHKALEQLRPGNSYSSIEDSIRIYMYNELVRLEFIRPQRDAKNKIDITLLFMPHSLGHSIGLETHDKPDHLDILKEGMVITVEPGIYFNESLLASNPSIKMKKLEPFMSIGGIRLEDVLLITKDSYKNLVDIPMTIEEIEELIE